jgi:hypothetical protein
MLKVHEAPSHSCMPVAVKTIMMWLMSSVHVLVATAFFTSVWISPSVSGSVVVPACGYTVPVSTHEPPKVNALLMEPFVP